MKKHKIVTFLALCILLSACNSGSESGSGSNITSETASSGQNTETPAVNQNTEPDSFGFLIDSPVAGLRYRSGEHTGITDSAGKFEFISGKNIEFYIGRNLIGYTTSAESTYWY